MNKYSKNGIVICEQVFMLRLGCLIGVSRVKIGRSSNNEMKSILRFGKESEIFIKISVKNGLYVKNKILKEFNKHFKLVQGRTFFEGELKKMEKIFISVVKKCKEDEISNDEESDDEESDDEDSDDEDSDDEEYKHYDSDDEDSDDEEYKHYESDESFIKNILQKKDYIKKFFPYYIKYNKKRDFFFINKFNEIIGPNSFHIPLNELNQWENEWIYSIKNNGVAWESFDNFVNHVIFIKSFIKNKKWLNETHEVKEILESVMIKH